MTSVAFVFITLSDMSAAWRQGVDRGRRGRDDRYQFLCGDRRHALASRGAIPTRMSVDLPMVTRTIIKTLPKGLLQGGEFVTARAREVASGMFMFYPSVSFPTEPRQKN
jgi:hypothetical protein